MGLAVGEVPRTEIKSPIRGINGNDVDWASSKDFVWQIRPTLNGKLIKPWKALPSSHPIRYHIPLGIVSHAVSPPADHTQIYKALYDSDVLTNLPQIEILML